MPAPGGGPVCVLAGGAINGLDVPPVNVRLAVGFPDARDLFHIEHPERLPRAQAVDAGLPAHAGYLSRDALISNQQQISGQTMVASDGFAEFLREQLAPLGRVTMRRMLGKTGVFCNGLMFGMVSDDMLYLRVDEQNRAIFKEAESFPPLNYEKGGRAIDLSFWRVPERLLDEPDEFVVWARAALAAARRVASKRGGSGSGRKSAARPTN
jgi:DNA transformation protein